MTLRSAPIAAAHLVAAQQALNRASVALAGERVEQPDGRPATALAPVAEMFDHLERSIEHIRAYLGPAVVPARLNAALSRPKVYFTVYGTTVADLDVAARRELDELGGGPWGYHTEIHAESTLRTPDGKSQVTLWRGEVRAVCD